jgi:hypothetical protein
LLLDNEELLEILHENKLGASFDHDPGAFQMWVWAYEGSNSNELVCDVAFRPLREMGYVMWDLATVDHIDLYESLIHVLDHIRRRSLTRAELEEMNNSFHVRMDICRRGGTGYLEGRPTQREIAWVKPPAIATWDEYIWIVTPGCSQYT